MHFPPVPQCDVKVLLLIFSPKKRAFVGLIPIEQVCMCLCNLLLLYKLLMMDMQHTWLQFVKP